MHQQDVQRPCGSVVLARQCLHERKAVCVQMVMREDLQLIRTQVPDAFLFAKDSGHVFSGIELQIRAYSKTDKSQRMTANHTVSNALALGVCAIIVLQRLSDPPNQTIRKEHFRIARTELLQRAAI